MSEIEIRESVGVTPLIEVLKSLGGWPLVEKKTDYENARYSWSNALARVFGELKMPSIFIMGVVPDANDTLVNRFGVRHKDNLINFNNLLFNF